MVFTGRSWIYERPNNCLRIIAGGKNGEEPSAAILSETALEPFLSAHPELKP